jgi:small subunit ribosomal protein S17
MQALSSRVNAFQGGAVRAPARTSVVRNRSALVVQASKVLSGTVVSTAMNKTIVVAVERLQPHSRYSKRIRITNRFQAHDELNAAKLGDYVQLESCRPLSKNKRFMMAEILRTTE